MMRAVIVGAGMGGLMTALALRQSGVFSSIDVYEQTKEPTTAGAGLNIPPNGVRLCRWLGVDLDGGNPKGPQGVIDGDLFEWLGRNGRCSRGCRRDQLHHIGVGVAEPAPQALDRGDLLSRAHSTGERCRAPQGRR